MDAPPGEPYTKVQEGGEMAPVLAAETGPENVHTSRGAHHKDCIGVQGTPISTCFNKDRVQVPRLCEEPKRSNAQTAKAAPKHGIEQHTKHFQEALDCDHKHTQLPVGANGACTDEEALDIRYHARKIGLESFFAQSVVERRIPLEILCATFGVPLSDPLADPPSDQLLARLKKAIAVDMRKRIKQPGYNSVDDAIALVRNAQNILVLTGAGISTSLNIPDFRSSGGLYSKLEQMGFKDPESVFSRDTFEEDPKPFFSVASMILPPADGRYTPAHAFLRLLQDKGKLLTLYTQNIDGIDLAAGIKREKLVQLHGSFETATCTNCLHRVKGEEIFAEIRNAQVPYCVRCAKERQIRDDQMNAMRAQSGRSVRRKIQRSSTASTIEAAGIMRPDIVFMDEPPCPYKKRFERDCARVDLVLVLGTSLPVEPVRIMPNEIPPHVPQIYIGKNQMYPERVKKIDFDIQLLGECDVVAELLASGCGWDLQHEMLPKGTGIAIEPWCGTRHHHLIVRETLTVKREGEDEGERAAQLDDASVVQCGN